MSVALKKDLVLFIYCLARQTERSVDFSLHSSWDEFRQFYNESRVQLLESAVDALRHLAPGCDRRIGAEEVFGGGLLWAICYPVNSFMNRGRGVWRFRPDEVQFLLQTICAAHETVQATRKPDAADLVKLRMDLHCCEVLIEHKLCGVPQLQEGARIEHYLQPEHLQHTRIDELCPDWVRQPIMKSPRFRRTTPWTRSN